LTGPAEVAGMAHDLASMILRSSLGAVGKHRSNCAKCRRTPLAGELLHVFGSGEELCSLCLGELPEAERAPLRSERVHAAERRLSVMPRAA
jgi:hypothetical protein